MNKKVFKFGIYLKCYHLFLLLFFIANAGFYIIQNLTDNINYLCYFSALLGILEVSLINYAYNKLKEEYYVSSKK
jgi:hypothetical protein